MITCEPHASPARARDALPRSRTAILPRYATSCCECSSASREAMSDKLVSIAPTCVASIEPIPEMDASVTSMRATLLRDFRLILLVVGTLLACNALHALADEY